MKYKQLVKRVVNSTSKVIFMMAMLFAIAPCAGKMYEPKLPERLQQKRER